MHSVELSAWRSLCIRVQSGRGDVIWLHTVMRLCDVTSDDVTARRIVCINQLIDKDEARVIRANAVHEDLSRPLDIGLLRGPHQLMDGLLNSSGHLAGTKRRVTAADNWMASCSPVKVTRQTDSMFDEPSFMSMPSPPLTSAGNFAAQDFTLSGGDWQTSSGGTVSSYPAVPVDEFVAMKTEPLCIPDSFLTPNASPCSFTHDSPPPIHHSVLPPDQNDLDELSFFDHAARQDHSNSVKTSVLINEDKLPVLDLPTVTSYLDCLEQCAPLPQTAALHQAPLTVDYSRALPLTMGVGAGMEKASTLDEELLQNLFSTANTFLSSVTAAKTFDFGGSDVLFASC